MGTSSSHSLGSDKFGFCESNRDSLGARGECYRRGMTRRSAQEQRAPGSSGAYGLEIRGAAGAARLLVEARAGWPPLRIIRRSGPVAASPDVFGVSHAELRVRGGGGRIRIDRK